MKQVWQCDHCSRTSPDPEVVADHEARCVFNPAVQACQTCQNRMDIDPYSDICDCAAAHDTTCGDEKHCELWQLRTREHTDEELRRYIEYMKKNG